MTPAQRALVRTVSARLLGRDHAEKLGSVPLYDEGFGFDVFGFERESATIAYMLGRLLHRYWFRVESTGHEHVPTRGRAILAPNHSGIVPLDAWMIGVDLATHMDPPRVIRSMVDYLAFELPYVGVGFQRIGQIAGTRRNFAELMRRDELLCVFPEGHKGTGKLYRDRYKLLKFNVGHVELSLEHRAPIIPVAVVGAEDQAPMLLDAKPVARLLGLPYFPITPTFPLFGLAGFLPLPVKYHILYGEPLRLWEKVSAEEAHDPETVAGLAETVRAKVGELLRTGLQRRRGVFV
jgi:1-acyl-sn-glycerol-3-phosphate acyltransferase